jgi:hypothetical protein
VSPSAFEAPNPGHLLQLLHKVGPSSPLFRRCRELLEDRIETGPLVPPATPRREPRFLTIGLAFEGDADSVRRSIDAVLSDRQFRLDEVEFLVVDVNAASENSARLKALETSVPNYRYVPYRAARSAELPELIVREAAGEFVLLIGRDARDLPHAVPVRKEAWLKANIGKAAGNEPGIAAGPFHFFDAIYCINLDRQPERWATMQRRFGKLGIERGVRRFPAASTPINHQIGCALSHRRLIDEARRQGFETVLAFEDDARFSADAAEVLGHSLRELADLDWQLLYLGGYSRTNEFAQVPGCPHLSIPKLITCTHAIAYHRSVFEAILDAIPESPIDVAVWVGRHLAIDQFYAFSLPGSRYLTQPVIATQDNLLPVETREFPD